MAAARIMNAREADASLHAPDLLQEAENELHRAREGLSDAWHYRTSVDAAARACLRADEARVRAVQEKAKISRITDRCLREIQALIEEARSRGAEELQGARLGSYSTRHGSLCAAFESGALYEVHEGALVLKNDLLGFLRELEESGK